MLENFIVRYFVESFRELRRVTWLTKTQAIRLTTLVIVFSLVTAAFLGALDFLFSYVYNQLLDLV